MGENLLTIEKCIYSGCEHTIQALHEDTHDEAICWKITKPELADEPTNEKYCPCKRDKNFIRRYDRVGYTEAEVLVSIYKDTNTKHSTFGKKIKKVFQLDSMITKKCSKCGVDALFRVDDATCITCRTRADYDSV